MLRTNPPHEPIHHLDLGTMPTERLEAELCSWSSALAAADCRFLELIAEFDRRGGWRAWGMRSTADWLSWKCALSPIAARERVRVAVAVATLPHTLERFRGGQLSYSKVRAITRVATAETELDLLGLAENCTAGQLEQVVRGWRKCMDAHDLDRHGRQLQKRRFVSGYDDDGSLTGRFSVPTESGPLVEKAIETFLPARIVEAAPGEDVEPDSISQRRSDALVAMADAALNSVGRKPHEKTMVVVEVEEDVLTCDATGTCQTDRGVAVAAETARRLACDCTEMHVTVDDTGDESTGPNRPRAFLVPSDEPSIVVTAASADSLAAVRRVGPRPITWSTERMAAATTSRTW